MSSGWDPGFLREPRFWPLVETGGDLEILFPVKTPRNLKLALRYCPPSETVTVRVYIDGLTTTVEIWHQGDA